MNRHLEGLAKALRQRGHRVVVMAPDGKRDGEFVSAGRSLPVPFNRSVARLGLGPGVPKAVLSTRREEFDLIHLHEPLVPGPCLLCLAAGTRPMVGTFHAAREEGSLIYALGRPILSRLLGRLSARIVVSPAAESFVSRYFPADYRMIPNGVDTDRFTPEGKSFRERLGFDRRDFVLLFVGRNEPRKGLGLALEAFRRLRRLRRDVRMMVAGTDYPPRREEGLVVLGTVREEELPSVYRTADVLLAPSLGGESFGMILVEAMACGVPVIASDIQGYRFVLEGGRGGKLVPPGDVKALREAIEEIAEDPLLRKELSAKALSRAHEFSWQRISRLVEEVYLEVGGEKRRTGGMD